eukprot:Gb_07911 [translate_table: standard]
MFRSINRNLNKLCIKCRIRGPRRRRMSKPKIMIRMANESKKSGNQPEKNSEIVGDEKQSKVKTIRLATFNAALFSMASAIPRNTTDDSVKKEANGENAPISVRIDIKGKSAVGPSSSPNKNIPSSQMPRGILKHFPSCHSSNPSVINPKRKLKFGEGSSTSSRLRVSINLPDNEISLSRMRHSKPNTVQEPSSSRHGSASLTNSSLSPNYHSKTPQSSAPNLVDSSGPSRYSISSTPDREVSPRIHENSNRNRSILEVLREVDADLVALQEVKAEEEKGMKPLSELAEALGMKYVFAESWAPEYGNAVLSKWPIKSWSIQKIVDASDFRNVLKVVVDVPSSGELHFHCTHLDHLDEDWRMKQIKAMMDMNNAPHILIGGLNSLDTMDYSQERWEDIVKFYEDKGKPTPKGEVMKLLRGKGYVDAKHFAGECESVVVLARGQEVQGTCKYGTRVDYILASRHAPYKFVPGSYAVVSSRGTSDHHVVKVDIQFAEPLNAVSQPKTIRVWQPSSKGIWRTN